MGGPPGMGMPNAGGMAAGMQGQMQQQQAMQAQMQNQMKNMQGQMAAQKGQMPGRAGMMGMAGPGGAGGQDQEPDFRTPEGAVVAFLNALKAKDLNRLTEATALHAQNESSPRYKQTFQRIIEGTLSEKELGDLVARLEDYQISGSNQPKSSGTFKVILSKRGTGAKANSTFNIVITTRRERKGWGVSDISAAGEMKNQNYMAPARRSNR
jgi:hypothetical protein